MARLTPSSRGGHRNPGTTSPRRRASAAISRAIRLKVIVVTRSMRSIMARGCDMNAVECARLLIMSPMERAEGPTTTRSSWGDDGADDDGDTASGPDPFGGTSAGGPDNTDADFGADDEIDDGSDELATPESGGTIDPDDPTGGDSDQWSGWLITLGLA